MITYSTFSDRELAAFLKGGDRAAFTEIYDRFRGLLYIYACKIVKDDDAAEDLVQEIFISLWDKRADLVLKSSFSAYLYAAVRFKFFDLVDKNKVRSDYVEAFQLFLDRGECITDNYIDEKELAMRIESEIANLPDKMREVFVLSRKENLSNKDISARLNISEKTVKNQLSNALKILRSKLGLFAFIFLLVR